MPRWKKAVPTYPPFLDRPAGLEWLGRGAEYLTGMQVRGLTLPDYLDDAFWRNFSGRRTVVRLEVSTLARVLVLSPNHRGFRGRAAVRRGKGELDVYTYKRREGWTRDPSVSD